MDGPEAATTFLSARPRHEPRFGARLRAVRRRRGLTTRQVAAAAGVTKGFVGQIEREETSPSVSTLLRICDALGIGIGSLFDAPRGDLVRVADRVAVEFGGIDVVDWLLGATADGRLQVLLSEIAPGGGSGEEAYVLDTDHVFVFVLVGMLRIVVGEVEHRLGPGDALTYPPREPHTWANVGPERAVALWVLTPIPPQQR